MKDQPLETKKLMFRNPMFRFWVVEGPFWGEVRDPVNPYESEGMRMLRNLVHSIVVMIAVAIFSILVLFPAAANAQDTTDCSYSFNAGTGIPHCTPDDISIGGQDFYETFGLRPPSQPGYQWIYVASDPYDPTGLSRYPGTDCSPMIPGRSELDEFDPGVNVYTGGHWEVASCNIAGGFFPDTACELAALAGLIASLHPLIMKIQRWRSLGGVVFGGSTAGYIACDGRG